MDCKFCLTALLGIERNLTAGEIAGQVLLLSAMHKLDPRSSQLNVVMMGMGEPLHNYDNVVLSIRLLAEQHAQNYSSRRITVSTSGIVKNIERLGQDTKVHIAISLNASLAFLPPRLVRHRKNPGAVIPQS